METLQRRSLYHEQPPALQTKLDVNPTLIVSWWATGFALTAILIRVAGRWVRVERLFREDKIMLYSIIPLLARMAVIHVVLIWGTNNTVTNGLTEIEIHHREIGSKLVLVGRILYAMFIWIAKWTILELLKRTMGSSAGSWHKKYELMLRGIDAFLVLTFIAVVIATLTECQPFNHYWQVVPDPGPRCREGIAQLVTMGTCDIISDLVLVFFPIPLIVMSNMRMKRKISLTLLFLLSLILVAITAYRVPSTISRGSSQQYRSLLASLEILAASAVSNAVVIGSFIRDRGVKKAKFRSMSVGGSSLDRTQSRKQSVSMAHWGSDDDLVRDLGLSLHPSLQHRNTGLEASIRPAPPAMPMEHDIERAETDQPAAKWNLAAARKRKGDADDDDESVSSTSTDLKMRDLPPRSPGENEKSPQSPGKMSFFDVGGLVNSDDKTSTPPGVSRDSSIKDAVIASQRDTQISRNSSRAFLSDVGGLMASHREEAGDSSSSTASPYASTRRGSVGVRNFGRGGMAYNNTPRETIAEHSADGRKGSHRSNGSPVVAPSVGPGQDGPDGMSFGDAGGLLQ